MKGETLWVVMLIRVSVCCPLQAEALALSKVILYTQRQGIAQCVFYTDYEIIANLVMALQPPLHSDWRAFKEIFDTWKLIKKYKGYSCCYIAKRHNELAESLARRATRERWNMVCHTYPILLPVELAYLAFLD